MSEGPLRRVAAWARQWLRDAGFDVVRVRDPYRRAAYRALYSEDVLAGKPFYNIGAGAFYHPYWTNIDFVSDWYGAVQQHVRHHDLMSLAPLPIEPSSAHLIYTSHTIEHVSYEAVEVLFREAWRALRPGGVLRVTTGPDAETDFRALQRGDADWFYWDDDYVLPGSYEHVFKAPATSVPLEERWLHHVASQLAPNSVSPSPRKLDADAVRELIARLGFPAVLDELSGACQFDPQRPGNHISWWTHDRVIGLLRRAGFETVYRSGAGQSASPLLRRSPLFDSTHPQMSIYVEAIRS
jgi:predicted SAM-dependent methyltransferase